MTYARLSSGPFMQKRAVDNVIIMGAGYSCLALVAHSYQHGPPRTWAGPGRTEIWGLNAAAFAFDCDISFNMHDMLQEQYAWLKPWYTKWNRTVVTCRALKDVPCFVEYPLGEIMEEFGDPYLMNTTTYAMAAAKWCGAKKIMLFGTDFNYPNSEAYEHGRANVEYWIGKLQETGMAVQLPDNTTLMDVSKRLESGVYGYGMAQPEWERVEGSAEVRLKGFADIAVDFPDLET